MHDTYVNNKEKVLRTHTSPVQIHAMLKNKPPLSFISSGKVYRKMMTLLICLCFIKLKAFM